MSPSRSRPTGGRPSGDSAPDGSKRPRSPCPRGLARSRPTSGAEFPDCFRRRPWRPTRGRIQIVFRSSLAGPRFWHGCMVLPKPESTEPSSGGTGRGPDRDGDRIVLADLGWMAPVVVLLWAEGAAHAVAVGSKALSLADSCGASGRDLRLAGG